MRTLRNSRPRPLILVFLSHVSTVSFMSVCVCSFSYRFLITSYSMNSPFGELFKDFWARLLARFLARFLDGFLPDF